MINVTKSFLPPNEDFYKYLKIIWENNILTNRGPLVLELEEKLKIQLNVNNIILMNNGTIPLQISLKLLGLEGEVITTPFSFIATTSSIIWQSCKPVFVDIDSEYLTVDESKIEAAITKNTTCLLFTHVFGNPCNVIEIDKIAKKYNLNVIYDAAHCFGVRYLNNSIFNYGDISTCSFHATKIFHCGEGGAAFVNNNSLYNELFYTHNFGYQTENKFYDVGINGKLSEIHAALGLAILPYFYKEVDNRKILVEKYLNTLNSKSIKFIKIREGAEWNYSYFPIIFNDELSLLRCLSILNKNGIFPRRYFYPSLNTIEYVNSKDICEFSESISTRILCLPLSFDLKELDIDQICNFINANL